MPVVICEIDNHRNKHGEGLVLIGLKDIEEVIVFEEAHGSVSHLQMDASDAAHYPLEELGNEVLHLIDFADLEHFLQLSQEESLLDAVSEGPVLEQTLKQGDGKGSVFGEEEH